MKYTKQNLWLVVNKRKNKNYKTSEIYAKPAYSTMVNDTPYE